MRLFGAKATHLNGNEVQEQASTKVPEIQTPVFLSLFFMLLETYKMAKICNKKPNQTRPPKFSSNPALSGTFSLKLNSRNQPQICSCQWVLPSQAHAAVAHPLCVRVLAARS